MLVLPITVLLSTCRCILRSFGPPDPLLPRRAAARRLCTVFLWGRDYDLAGVQCHPTTLIPALHVLVFP